MATETWTGSTGAVSGNWSNASAWSGSVAPASGDTVLITQDLGQAYTVTLDANEGAYAALTISFRNATLALSDPGVTLTVAGPVTVSDGVISVTSAATLDANSISLTNGPVASGGLSIYAGAINTNALTVSGGTFLHAGGVLTAGALGVTSGNVAVTADAATMNLGSLTVAGGRVRSIGRSCNGDRPRQYHQRQRDFLWRCIQHRLVGGVWRIARSIRRNNYIVRRNDPIRQRVDGVLQ